MPLPDYRCLDYPYDAHGYPFFAEDENEELLNPNSAATLDDYLGWLSAYLLTIQLEPESDQLRWWNKYEEMTPEAAMRALGSDLGIQDAVACVGEDNPDYLGDTPTECDWHWPHNVAPPIDLGYRVLMARILREVEDQTRRMKLLQDFFAVYWEYACK